MNKGNTGKWWQSFIKSVWLFPVILTLVLILLTCFKINGSSIGVYHNFFYGSQKDPSLLLNKPEAIRSDEWVVETQMTIAQYNNGLKEVNKNIGNGANMSLLVDAPYKDWSQIFRPQNIPFFVLPFDNAFALKWWFMGYALILSAYFLILALLPKRRLFAALLSLALFFSPFVQWWYQYITLAPIYTALFAGLIFVYLVKQKKRIPRILLSIAFAYTLVAFAIIQYPPFQIPCAIAVALFGIGYLLNNRKEIRKNILRTNIIFVLISVVIGGVLIGLFLLQNIDTIRIIQDTAYPGKRVVASGGYSLLHLLTSNVSPLFQSLTRATAYSMPAIGVTNQSEDSNFILLLPALLFPALFLLYKNIRSKRLFDYSLILVIAVFLLFLAWLLVPSLDIIGKITFLDKVPLNRVLIGLGVVDLLFVVLFVKIYSDFKERLSMKLSAIYSVLLVLIYVVMDIALSHRFPQFMGQHLALVLALPIPIIIFFFLRKHFVLAAMLFLVFSLASTLRVNPLYVGTSVLRETPISTAIQSISKNSTKRWVTDDSRLENFAFMNGSPSLTGVYEYPQLSLWKPIDDTAKGQFIYNRYAHMTFVFNHTVGTPELSTKLLSSTADHFAVQTEICSSFIKNSDVGFVATTVTFDATANPCTHLLKTIQYPTGSFYLYGLTF